MTHEPLNMRRVERTRSCAHNQESGMRKVIDEGVKSRVFTRARVRGLSIWVGAAALASAAVVSCSSNYTEQGGEVIGEVRQMASAPVTVSFQNGVLPTAAYT